MTLRRSCALIALLVSTGCRTIVWYGHSPGRARSVEVIERSGHQRVVVDGEPGPSFDAVGVSGLTVLDRGAVVYAARRADGWLVVRDGREGVPWEGVGEVVVSGDGGHVAYAAVRDGAWHVVVDERAGPAFDGVFAGTLRLSDTGVVAYVAERHGRAHVVIGERVGRPHDAVSGLALSGDGAHVASLVRDGSVQRTVVDDVDGPAWLEVSDLVLLPGGRAVHAGRALDGWWVQGAATRYGPYDAVSSLRSAAAGPAFVARRDRREFVVQAGEEGPRYDRVVELVVGDDGRTAYVARRSGRHAVIVHDVVRGAWPVAAGLVLGPADRWAVVVHDGQGTRVVHDAGEVEIAAAMPDTLAFGAGGRWGVVAADDDGLFIAVEGGTRRRIDAEEVAAEAMRASGDLRGVSILLRRWVASASADGRE